MRNNPYFMYNDRAETYVEATRHLDMSPLYNKFLPLIPEGGSILDAGAGSGRDSKEFLSRGYDVTIMEPSSKLAAKASEYTGHEVTMISFQHMKMVEQFDGIWACSSLLHVHPRELTEVFTRFEYALKPDGKLYYSFKYGSGTHEKDGLMYLYMHEGDLELYIRNFRHIDQWVSVDIRPDRGGEQWLNGILEKI